MSDIVLIKSNGNSAGLNTNEAALSFRPVDGMPEITDGQTGLTTLLKGDKGDQGDVGPQGPQGNPGLQGNDGAVGPTDLVAKWTMTSTITLPNTTAKTFVDGITFNVPTVGNYVYTGKISYRPHNASNDMEFDLRLDNSVLPDDQIEEGKDVNATQKNGRPFQGDLGSLAAGNHDLDLYFSKESTGGTAQLKYISIFIWRVS